MEGGDGDEVRHRRVRKKKEEIVTVTRRQVRCVRVFWGVGAGRGQARRQVRCVRVGFGAPRGACSTSQSSVAGLKSPWCFTGF